MPTIKPRVNVVLSPSDAECLQLICDKKHMSMSGLVRKVVEEWLEDYEDELLSRRAEKSEERWIKEGCKTISLEDLCQELNIELSSVKNQEKILFDSPKTSKKGSSKLSTKDCRTRRKTVSH